MARSSHVVVGMRVRLFSKKLVKEILDDEVTDVAAMMTYYAIFALFPMMVFVLTVGLLVVPREAIQEGVAMATQAMPRSIGAQLSSYVDKLQASADAGFAILGAAVALWGASRGAAALGNALNRVFAKKETRSWVKRQLIAIATTVLVAVLIIVALGLMVAGPAIGHAVADRFGLGAAFDVLWTIGRWVGAAALVCLVWAVLYKLLPDTDAPFRIFTPGAVAGVILWVAVSRVFGFYLENFGDYEATYGALGGAIIFLLWLWLSNLAILVGAEINDVIADMRKHEDPAAAKLAQPGDKRDEERAARRVTPPPQNPVHGAAR